MSRGHTHAHDLSKAELDDLLAEALANLKVKRRLARPFKLDHTYDIALLGSSAVGGGTVYLDRHLRAKGKPFGILPLQGRWIDVKQPLIRHERLEQTLEDELGWPYEPIAHPVAEHWEEQLVKKMGFDPKAYERMLEPLIKADEVEKLQRIPTDLDLRPLMSDSEPEDKTILKHIREKIGSK